MAEPEFSVEGLVAGRVIRALILDHATGSKVTTSLLCLEVNGVALRLWRPRDGRFGLMLFRCWGERDSRIGADWEVLDSTELRKINVSQDNVDALLALDSAQEAAQPALSDIAKKFS